MIKCSKREQGEQDVYWPKEEMNDVISVFRDTESEQIRSDIYNIHIHSRLEKMNEIWARKVLGNNASDDVITDGLSFAARTLDKFNAKYGDSFGFLSVSLKRYYQQIGMVSQKYNSKHSSLEDLKKNNDGDVIEIELTPMYEPSFRDDTKLNLLMEFLGDERNYNQIAKQLRCGSRSLPIRHLKNLYQLLKLNDDKQLDKKHLANLLRTVSPVFLKWLENHPEGAAEPVVIYNNTALVQCKCVECGKEVPKPSTHSKKNTNVICDECRYKKRIAYKPPTHAFKCTTCHADVYRRYKPRNGIICCPACKEKSRLDKVNKSRKNTAITYRLKNNLEENEIEQKEEVVQMISMESICQLNKNNSRIIEFFANNELQSLSVHSASITFSEQTEQSIRFFRGVADLPVRNGTYLSYKCNMTETVATDQTVDGRVNLKKLKRETTLRKVVRPEGYIPKSKQKMQVSCPKCGKSREVGYALYIKSKDKPIMCRQCWASDKDYISKRTAKAVKTKNDNRVKEGFVRKEDQKCELTCPKCGKVREVCYSYYLLKHNNPPLCHTCCNSDPELLERKISKRLETIKHKHIITGFVPKSQKKHTITCHKCGETREGSYSLLKKTKKKSYMCQKCSHSK